MEYVTQRWILLNILIIYISTANIPIVHRNNGQVKVNNGNNLGTNYAGNSVIEVSENSMLWNHGRRGKSNKNLINNKDSAEQISKSFIDVNEKLQIRVMWSQINTTEEWLEKQKEKQNEYQNNKDDTIMMVIRIA